MLADNQALRKAWDEHPEWRELHEKLRTHAGAHALPDWVDEKMIRADEFSPDRALIDKLAYEYNTVLRWWIERSVEIRAAEIYHYDQITEVRRRITAGNERALGIQRRLHELRLDGRKTVRIDELLEGTE